LNVIKPCLRLASEALFSRGYMRLELFGASLIVRVLVAILMISSFLLLLLHLDWLLSSRRRSDDGRGNNWSFLHLDIIVLLLLLFLVMLSTSVTLLESTSVLLASLVAIVAAVVAIASVRFSARLYFLEIFHLVYIPTIILY
jgi:uncharacterized membrane-anchored protein